MNIYCLFPCEIPRRRLAEAYSRCIFTFSEITRLFSKIACWDFLLGWWLCWSFWRELILKILSFLVHEHGICLHLFRSWILSTIYGHFSVYRSSISFCQTYPHILHVFTYCSLLLYKIHLIFVHWFYPTTWIHPLVNLVTFSEESVGLPINT